MDHQRFDRQVDAACGALQARLGARGRSLAARLKRAGRRLPKEARAAGAQIVAAQQMAAHPRLARLVADDRTDAAFATLTAHLKGIDPADRRKGAVLSLAGAVVFDLLVVAALVIAVLVWRGFV
jgi:hypothetical protein